MVVAADPVGCHLLVLASDLSDHHDALRLGVLHEALQHVNEVGAIERVTTDAHHRGLAQTRAGGLVHGLVRERARAGHDADLAVGMDVAGHDSDLALVGLDDAGAVGLCAIAVYIYHVLQSLGTCFVGEEHA